MKKRKLKPGTRKTFKNSPAPTIIPFPWDKGADGAANRDGLIAEQAVDADPETGEIQNPNAVTRYRRVDLLEKWMREDRISLAGWTAGMQLRLAYEATQKAPGWPDNDRVQSSPKPDHAVTIQIDRLSAFAKIYRHVPPADRPIIDACVLHGKTPAGAGYRNGRYHMGFTALRSALDRLATDVDRK